MGFLFDLFIGAFALIISQGISAVIAAMFLV